MPCQFPRVRLAPSISTICLGRPLPHCCSIICVYCGLCALSLPADPSASFFQGFFTISGSKRVFLVSIIIINLKHFPNYFHGFGVRKAKCFFLENKQVEVGVFLSLDSYVFQQYSKKKKLEASVSRKTVTEWAQQSIFPHSSWPSRPAVSIFPGSQVSFLHLFRQSDSRSGEGRGRGKRGRKRAITKRIILAKTLTQG